MTFISLWHMPWNRRKMGRQAFSRNTHNHHLLLYIRDSAETNSNIQYSINRIFYWILTGLPYIYTILCVILWPERGLNRHQQIYKVSLLAYTFFSFLVATNEYTLSFIFSLDCVIDPAQFCRSLQHDFRCCVVQHQQAICSFLLSFGYNTGPQRPSREVYTHTEIQ